MPIVGSRTDSSHWNYATQLVQMSMLIEQRTFTNYRAKEPIGSYD